MTLFCFRHLTISLMSIVNEKFDKFRKEKKLRMEDLERDVKTGEKEKCPFIFRKKNKFNKISRKRQKSTSEEGNFIIRITQRH